MDTKLKKSSPFIAWLGFFIGINMILCSVMGSFVISRNMDVIFARDYKETAYFKRIISEDFLSIFLSASRRQDSKPEGANMMYFGSIENRGSVLDNHIATNFRVSSFNEALSLVSSKAGEYSYIFVWDGNTLAIKEDGVTTHPYDDEMYSQILKGYQENDLKDYRAVIAVKPKLASHSGSVYSAYIDWIILRVKAISLIAVFLLGTVLLILSSIRRAGRKEFSRKLAYYSNKMSIEVKIILSLFILACLNKYYSTGARAAALLALFWWAWLMLIDLSINKAAFFKNNLISWSLRMYYRYEKKKSFQKNMLNRFSWMIGIESVLIFLTLISLIYHNPVLSLLFISVGVYIVFNYIKWYGRFIDDIGKVVDHSELIRNGDLNTRLVLHEDSPMHKTAENLNNIQEGVFTAVQEQLKSERMKIDLITNVSHDLKTPLTAIVSYVDLLGREDLSPEFANDYVRVLVNKTARLTALTQDIFDISKAQSGNLELNIEKIDIVELIKQSIAELDEKIRSSSLDFKVNLPNENIYINSDGRKLYRVFDNLISNILKYSLKNTRVYIDLTEDRDSINLTFKNIASYEMNMSAEDLMERFVRGDESRTTEGSGLGLAIVQSFVALCGGSFEIKIDGDLFKAIVGFKKA